MDNACYLLKSLLMPKDAPLAFRIPNELKRRLQDVAKGEARSISQICEMLLVLGVECYEKEGSKFLQGFLARQKKRYIRLEAIGVCFSHSLLQPPTAPSIWIELSNL